MNQADHWVANIFTWIFEFEGWFINLPQICLELNCYFTLCFLAGPSPTISTNGKFKWSKFSTLYNQKCSLFSLCFDTVPLRRIRCFACGMPGMYYDIWQAMFFAWKSRKVKNLKQNSSRKYNGHFLQSSSRMLNQIKSSTS